MVTFWTCLASNTEDLSNKFVQTSTDFKDYIYNEDHLLNRFVQILIDWNDCIGNEQDLINKYIKTFNNATYVLTS